jgi:hypothetical protein
MKSVSNSCLKFPLEKVIDLTHQLSSDIGEDISLRKIGNKSIKIIFSFLYAAIHYIFVF